MRTWLLALTAMGLSIAPALADERVQEKDVPKPIIETVKKKYPAARFTSFYKDAPQGKLRYEVHVRDENRSVEVDCSPEGKILEEAERIDEDSIPKEVKAALVLSKYGRWFVRRVDKVTKDEKTDAPFFELVLAERGRVFDVVFDAAGKITKEERRERPGEESLSWDVLDSTRKKYPKARLEGFTREHEKGELMIELRLVEGTHDISVVVSASSGKIVKERETVEIDSLPKEIKAGLDASKYAGWTIAAAERIVHDENAADPSWELVLSSGWRRAEVLVDKAGKVSNAPRRGGG